MSSWLYMFKASSLQRYIFATNKLRDVIGGSQLVSELTRSLLDDTLGAIAPGQEGVVIVQRVAGSATILFEDGDAARRFYTTWPLLVAHFAPDLEVQQWLGEVGDDMPLIDTLQRGWDGLREARVRPMRALPEVSPVMLRAPRSGAPAVGRDKSELVGEASRRKRAQADLSRGVVAGFQPEDVDAEWQGMSWTTDLRDMVRGEKSYLAVVHADGNRLGSFLIEVADEIRSGGLDDGKIAPFYTDFSEGLARATRQALLDAFKGRLDDPRGEHVGARPIVLGGDDVTFLVPSARAVKITEAFLREFERHSRELIETLCKEYPLAALEKRRASGFSACAGIVFQRESQPLLASYEHAEALCSHAKRLSDQESGHTASSLLFSRVLDSADVDFVERLAADFVDPISEIRLSSGPYAIDGGCRDLASMNDLRNVSNSLNRMARGALRGVIDQLHHNEASADTAFERLERIDPDRARGLRGALLAISQKSQHAHAHLLSSLVDAAMLESMED